MYAVIETGGKQYRVKAGDKLRLEKIHAEDGPVIGAPYIEGAAVTGKILEHGKEDKVIVFRYHRKKNYRKFRGHRQQYTLIQIDGING